MRVQHQHVGGIYAKLGRRVVKKNVQGYAQVNAAADRIVNLVQRLKACEVAFDFFFRAFARGDVT